LIGTESNDLADDDDDDGRLNFSLA